MLLSLFPEIKQTLQYCGGAGLHVQPKFAAGIVSYYQQWQGNEQKEKVEKTQSGGIRRGSVATSPTPLLSLWSEFTKVHAQVLLIFLLNRDKNSSINYPSDTYLMYVLALPSGNTYGCFFLKTWPTLLQGRISRLPPHCQTRNEISAHNTNRHKKDF